LIQYQLKLRLNAKQEATLNEWLFMLTGVWNWAVRKIQMDAANKIYFTPKDFQNLLANHGEKMGVPSHTLQGMLSSAHLAWKRCFKKIAKKPRLKGKRNRLNSVPFPDPFRSPKDGRIAVPGLGKVRFHKMDLPEGKIRCGRVVRRASGWYLCLFIDAEPKLIPHTGNGQIGIDSGFKNLLTLSNGEVIEHPRELEASEERLAQAQRGGNKKLAARLQEHLANRRKDRNHKLSRRLVAENAVIRFSGDRHKGIARRFGKSVSSSGHGQLRQMLSYKSRAGGRAYDEPDSKFSTMTCSNCGARTGPTGLGGLAVRHWCCSACGAQHDRDVNAARNALFAGAGIAHEECYANA
jgi:putative transposase